MAKRRRSPELSRRRRRRMPVWLKALWAVAFLIVGYFCVCSILKTVRPFILAWNGKQEVRRLESQIADGNRTKQEYLEKRRYLRSQEGAQTEARKLGYVKEGETSIMIEQEKKKQVTK